jgi:hypothetical protein
MHEYRSQSDKLGTSSVFYSKLIGEVMHTHTSVYDWQKYLDPRAVMALRKLGVNASRIIGQPGSMKACKFCFTYTGDSEQVKHIVATFLQDEYNATRVQFWVNQSDRTQVYATFNYGGEIHNV